MSFWHLDLFVLIEFSNQIFNKIVIIGYNRDNKYQYSTNYDQNQGGDRYEIYLDLVIF